MSSTLLLISLASSASALSTLMRFGCDGGFDVAEKTVFGPLSARFNGAAKMIEVRSLRRKKKKKSFFFVAFHLTHQKKLPVL